MLQQLADPAHDADVRVDAMPQQRRVAVLFFNVFVEELGFGILTPCLPLYADGPGASGLEIGLLLAIYSQMQMLVSTRWGRLSVRIGRRPILVASAAGSAVAFSILGFADSLAWLFVGRALLGSFGVGM